MKGGDGMEDLKEILILLIVLALVSNFKPIFKKDDSSKKKDRHNKRSK